MGHWHARIKTLQHLHSHTHTVCRKRVDLDTLHTLCFIAGNMAQHQLVAQQATQPRVEVEGVPQAPKARINIIVENSHKATETANTNNSNYIFIVVYRHQDEQTRNRSRRSSIQTISTHLQLMMSKMVSCLDYFGPFFVCEMCCSSLYTPNRPHITLDLNEI